MTGRTTVVVVDDHPVVLAGLVALISAEPVMEVVGSAPDVGAAMALTPEEPPDVCVLDLQLPDGDGVTLGVELKARWPTTRVLILTMSDDPAAVIRSLAAGLDGFVLKDSDPAELVSAIRAAAEGVVVLGRRASRPVIAAASALPASTRWPASTRAIERSSCCWSAGSPRRRSRTSCSSPRRRSATA